MCRDISNVLAVVRVSVAAVTVKLIASYGNHRISQRVVCGNNKAVLLAGVGRTLLTMWDSLN
jgi:hypothetical protein